MNKILKTILIISIAVFGAGFLLVLPTNAQTNGLIIEYWTGTDWKFLEGPIFSETNFLPGQRVTRLVRVTNNSGQPQRVAVEAINWPEFPEIDNVPEKDLSRALNIVIREKDGSDLYGGSSLTGKKTLFNFYQDNETYLSSDISTGSFKEYEFEIIFPAEKEKEWQSATTTFDILIGFQGAGGQVPPGGGGGGLPPGLTIQYEKDFYIGITTAIIVWDTSYESTSQVVYDTLPGKFNLNPDTGGGPPNYGYAFSKQGDDIFGLEKGKMHRVTLTGLLPGITYYYRCVSHGSFAVSIEHSFTTLGVKKVGEEVEPIIESVFVSSSDGETPAGEAAGESASAESSGETKNEEEIAEGLERPELVEVEMREEQKTNLGKFFAAIGGLFNFKNIYWLLIILIIVLVFLILLFKNRKKRET